MLKVTIAEWFLSLFTTPDRASAIAGDLVEQGRAPWFNVLRTAAALFVQSATVQPLRLALFVLLGLALLRIAIYSASIAFSWLPYEPLELWPGLVAPALIGYVIARLAQGREVTACLALVFTHALLQLPFIRHALVHGWSAYRICTILLFTDAIPALAILAGAIFARKLVLNRQLSHAN